MTIKASPGPAYKQTRAAWQPPTEKFSALPPRSTFLISCPSHTALDSDSDSYHCSCYSCCSWDFSSSSHPLLPWADYPSSHPAPPRLSPSSPVRAIDSSTATSRTSTATATAYTTSGDTYQNPYPDPYPYPYPSVRASYRLRTVSAGMLVSVGPAAGSGTVRFRTVRPMAVVGRGIRRRGVDPGLGCRRGGARRAEGRRAGQGEGSARICGGGGRWRRR